jgi:Plasmid pRiA4b ORF-3-like protein
VRVDEVLVEPGDRLYYSYDFGDDWQHVIRLEAVSARQADPARPGPPSRAVCTGGDRDGPAEDCGGVYAYELITAATDPQHAGHAEATAEHQRIFGTGIDAQVTDAARFDVNEINAKLAAEFPAFSTPRASNPGDAPAGGLPGPLAELVSTVQTSAGRRELQHLLDAARLGEPVAIDAATAEKVVRPYAWLLDRVGSEGIKLTGAGYLPPTQVEAALAALDLGQEWIGKGNREVQTLPVLHLRESAMKAGLLRKHRGMLVATPRGRSLRGDPVGVWWQLAERLPFKSGDACEAQASLLLLIVMAADAPGDPDPVVARLLGAIGWINRDGSRLTSTAAAIATFDTRSALRRVGSFGTDGHPFGSETPATARTTLARAALQTWPS